MGGKGGWDVGLWMEEGRSRKSATGSGPVSSPAYGVSIFGKRTSINASPSPPSMGFVATVRVDFLIRFDRRA